MKTYYEDKWVFPLYLLIAASLATVDSYFIDNQEIDFKFYLEMLIPFSVAGVIYFSLTKNKVGLSLSGIKKKGINYPFKNLSFLLKKQSFYIQLNVVEKNSSEEIKNIWNIGTTNIAKGLLENVPKDHPDYKVLEEFYRVQNKLFS